MPNEISGQLCMIGISLLVLLVMSRYVRLLQDGSESVVDVMVTAARQTSADPIKTGVSECPPLSTKPFIDPSSAMDFDDTVRPEQASSIPFFNDLTMSWSDQIDNDEIAHITAQHDAGISKRSLGVAVGGQLSAQTLRSKPSSKCSVSVGFTATTAARCCGGTGVTH